MIELKRERDDTFKCRYEKHFKLPTSLQRHAKNCRDEITQSEKIKEEDIRMHEEDYNASESPEFNGQQIDDISIDCYNSDFLWCSGSMYVISDESCRGSEPMVQPAG